MHLNPYFTIRCFKEPLLIQNQRSMLYASNHLKRTKHAEWGNQLSTMWHHGSLKMTHYNYITNFFKNNKNKKQSPQERAFLEKIYFNNVSKFQHQTIKKKKKFWPKGPKKPHFLSKTQIKFTANSSEKTHAQKQGRSFSFQWVSFSFFVCDNQKERGPNAYPAPTH